MSIATGVLAHTGIMRKKHRADRRYDKMSIATDVLAHTGIMRKKHRTDRRHDKMSIATDVLAHTGIMRERSELYEIFGSADCIRGSSECL